MNKQVRDTDIIKYVINVIWGLRGERESRVAGPFDTEKAAAEHILKNKEVFLVANADEFCIVKKTYTSEENYKRNFSLCDEYVYCDWFDGRDKLEELAK